MCFPEFKSALNSCHPSNRKMFRYFMFAVYCCEHAIRSTLAEASAQHSTAHTERNHLFYCYFIKKYRRIEKMLSLFATIAIWHSNIIAYALRARHTHSAICVYLICIEQACAPQQSSRTKKEKNVRFYRWTSWSSSLIWSLVASTCSMMWMAPPSCNRHLSLCVVVCLMLCLCVCRRAIELQTPLESCNSGHTNTRKHGTYTQTRPHNIHARICCASSACGQHGMDGRTLLTSHCCGVCLFAIMLYCFACTGIWKFGRQIVQNDLVLVCVCVRACMSNGIVSAVSMHIHIDEQLKRNYSPLCALVRASASLRHRHRRTFVFIFNLFCVDLLKMFCAVPYAMAKLSGFAANYKRFMPTMMTSSRELCVCEGFLWLVAGMCTEL